MTTYYKLKVAYKAVAKVAPGIHLIIPLEVHQKHTDRHEERAAPARPARPWTGRGLQRAPCIALGGRL